MDCYRKTIARDGLKGLWIGWGPNVVRNSLINAAEVSTYDQAKQVALQKGYKDDTYTHLACAIVASANASWVGAPADAIKTKAMNQRDPSKSLNYVEIGKSIYRKGGARAFFKGLDAVFFRLSCWNCIMFVTLEKIKASFYDPTMPD